MAKKRKIRIKKFFEPIQQGYQRLEIITSLYLSLFASLLLNVCANRDYISWWIFISICLLGVGFALSAISNYRISIYKKDYDELKQLKISLGEYIGKKEKESDIKTCIQTQYLLIHIIWIPAIILLFIAGGQITGQTRVKDEALKTIEKSTLLIDSVFHRTNAIYEQNVLLMDSITTSKEDIENLAKHVDLLRMEVEKSKNKKEK